MANDIKAPVFPESIADGTVAAWHKQPGDYAERDELLVDIETDKVVLEVVAPDDGTLQEVLKNEGDVVQSEEVLGRFEIGAGAPSDGKAGDDDTGTAEKDTDESENRDEPVGRDLRLSPAARKLIDERDVPAEQVKGSGRGGLVLKEDVLDYLEQQADQGGGKAKKEQTDKKAEPPAPERDRDSAKSDTDNKRGPAAEPEPTGLSGERVEKRVPMTRMRARIAERLMDARRNTAMLTTFNEVDMQPVMQLRERYRDRFESRHGVRLGFMGFFVKAATEVLKRFPMVNASIDGSDVVYHGYQDIGIAVSTDRGLVVPILRETDAMGIADIEARIIDFGKRAHDGKLSIEDMRGGTFTITNGGVFGSLLSTPILNPPQSAILGMHKIEKRPVVIGDAIEIRPMMYLALSYDHRLVDGKDSVQFLVAIKELLEDPARILLDV